MNHTHRPSRLARLAAFCLCGWLVVAPAAVAGNAAATTASLRTKSFADLSLEELLNESVRSVSKKETKLSESAAAIAVVTGDDFRRLGITSLPEALRLVPGMSVGRLNASKWGVSSRGFFDQFANELLVLIDGRTVYTPAFAGVYWDIQDVLLEDLDRVEAIRGPGATLWGANAVNGVINIATKSAKDTQGHAGAGACPARSVHAEERPERGSLGRRNLRPVAAGRLLAAHGRL